LEEKNIDNFKQTESGKSRCGARVQESKRVISY
jgi:hypothetical protein